MFAVMTPPTGFGLVEFIRVLCDVCCIPSVIFPCPVLVLILILIMPFVLPAKVLSKLPISRFKDVVTSDLDDKSRVTDFILQKRKKAFRHSGKPLYRIITTAKSDGTPTKHQPVMSTCSVVVWLEPVK